VLMVLQFLFGSGWMVVWHALIWLGVLLLVVVPMMQLVDYMRGGRDPGPAAPIMLASVLIPAVFLGLLTLVHGVMFMPMVTGPWHAQVLAIFAGVTLAVAFPVLPGIIVANMASRAALVMTWLLLLGVLWGNLVLLYVRATRDADTITFRPDGLLTALLAVLAAPSVLFLMGSLVGILTRVRGR